jgi:hypothetical protein
MEHGSSTLGDNGMVVTLMGATNLGNNDNGNDNNNGPTGSLAMDESDNGRES